MNTQLIITPHTTITEEMCANAAWLNTGSLGSSSSVASFEESDAVGDAVVDEGVPVVGRGEGITTISVFEVY